MFVPRFRLALVLSLSLLALACRDEPAPATSNSDTPASEPAAPSEAAPPQTVELHLVEPAGDAYILPVGWRVPVADLGPARNIDAEVPTLGLQRDGLYYDSKRLLALDAIEASAEFANIDALYGVAKESSTNLFHVGRLFIDPELPMSTVLRTLATLYRAGWSDPELMVTSEASSPRASHVFELGGPPPPPPPSPPGTEDPYLPGWFDIVVDVGADATRVGKFVPSNSPGSKGPFKPGEFRGTAPVSWLEPEAGGDALPDRIAGRVAALREQLRAVDASIPPVVHLSVELTRPLSELVSVMLAIRRANCPEGHDWSASGPIGCAVTFILRAGPPPQFAVSEIFSDDFLAEVAATANQ